MKKTNTTFAHGVKVGDIFETSWGYDQTNVNFFQVIAVTEKSARVREVYPSTKSTVSSGPMAEDRVYDIPDDGELLPPAEYSVFIPDNKKGAMKRISVYDFGHGKNTYIKLSSFATGRKLPSGDFKCYVSWYA